MQTIIIGGGQAGLSVSYFLKQAGHKHIILEQAEKAGNAWQNDRWDSFTLVTPNWTINLPDGKYAGSEPHGFMPRDEIVKYFEDYIKKHDLPVEYGTKVLEVTPLGLDMGYEVKTNGKTFQAENIVIATGQFQKPKILPFSTKLPSNILQLHSGQYRNPKQIPEGAVLIIGSGQSGCQITEELYQSGRTVYLCVGSAGRVPRRYRGKDIFEWLELTGFTNRTVDILPSPKAKFGGNPQANGKNGGHTINLHQFVRDGVKLLGHIADVQNGKIILSPDLKESLVKVDKLENDIIAMIDNYIEKNQIDAPLESLPKLQDGYSVEEILEIDLSAANINTIIWAIGYTFDYSLVKLPITDEDGYPIQQRGATKFGGLYFVGMNWLHKHKSSLLLGVAEDAEYVAKHIIEKF